jgi:glucose-1-phosphate cytidylyltransferase
MKTVILAGGLGTRISEYSMSVPKPMVPIGGEPILWHIMKIYSYYGLNDFIICCGYKGYVIKEYFAIYFKHQSDITFNLKDNKMIIHEKRAEPCSVTLIDTGDDTMTGGRLKRVMPYLKGENSFCLTYGDGVANININNLLDFHKPHGKDATLTAVYPPGRFGALDIVKGKVQEFQEKPRGDGAFINGGFFVLSPNVIDRIKDDLTVW